MSRVTVDEVKLIITTTLSNTAIESFINAASGLVTSLLGSSTVLTADQLSSIELFLSAHFIACGPERQLKTEEAGQAKDSYGGNFGMGLDFTSYGQQVKVLDVTGVLAQKISKQAMSLYAVPAFEDDYYAY